MSQQRKCEVNRCKYDKVGLNFVEKLTTVAYAINEYVLHKYVCLYAYKVKSK